MLGRLTYLLILVGIALGGSIGYVTRSASPMTAMPQLVAAFHSLVGLAAVFVACGAFLSPARSASPTRTATIHGVSLFEMGLGIVIGAITFSGSVIAFGKLQAAAGVENSPPCSIVASAMSSRPIISTGTPSTSAASAVVVLLIAFSQPERARSR